MPPAKKEKSSNKVKGDMPIPPSTARDHHDQKSSNSDGSTSESTEFTEPPMDIEYMTMKDLLGRLEETMAGDVAGWEDEVRCYPPCTVGCSLCNVLLFIFSLQVTFAKFPPSTVHGVVTLW